MKSWKTPTPEQVDRAVALLGHAEHYRYFFDRLENPEWISPLKSKGFFSNPPKTQRDKTRGTIHFPPWPESRYLARMASLSPEVALEVILQIPDTDNVRVCEDLPDAALSMPPDLSVQLVEKAKNWARLPYQLGLPEKLGSLIAHLAKDGKVDAALELARVLLEILPDLSYAEKSEAEETYRLPPEPRARFDIWEYEEILKKDFPELVKGAGIQAFELLCDLLKTFIQFSQRRKDKEGSEDYSYIWRPAIEEHKENEPKDLKDILVSGVRDTAAYLIKNNAVSISELVRNLETRRWKIFHRIALHLLRQFPDAEPDLITARLTNYKLFDDHGMRHEYALLIGECFAVIPRDRQPIILGWIDKGPDLAKFKRTREQWTGKQITDKDEIRHKKIWQRDRLSWFKSHLPEEWKRRYEELVAEFGEPEHPEFSSYSGATWEGPFSPKTADELQKISVTDVIAFLKDWEPAKDLTEPSPEGLGRELSSAVAQNPTRFSLEAMKFVGLDPTYVRSLLSGLREVIKQKRVLDWPPVLDLCRWIVNQPREIPGREKSHGEADPDWGWTRKTIAELLSSGFEEGESCINYKCRSLVWEILRQLTDDPDPTPEHEVRYGGSNMDPATLSVNTTRGEVMHSVIQYALWIHRHFSKLPDAASLLARGFDEMPEVQEVLEEHLDVSKDPSLAIRSVYGQWFPWIVLLDSNWAKSYVSQIFPISATERTFRDAAWETYIVFCAPYDPVLDVLKDQYACAVENIGIVSKDKRLLADPDERLANHLIVFYARGKIDLSDPEGKFYKFWTKASDKLRGHALAHAGELLQREMPPPEILKRLQALWESRLAVAKVSPDNHKAEMAAFGWWFVSKKFDDKWAIDQLIESLEISGKTKPDHLVIEQLANTSRSIPKESVRCLELMIKGDEEGWRIYSWRKHAQEILATAIQSPDFEVVQAAENLVHYLGSKGYFEFRDLLKNR